MDVLELVPYLDGFVALVIAVWVIREGMVRVDNMQENQREFSKVVLEQQQENNNELMALVNSLCRNTQNS